MSALFPSVSTLAVSIIYCVWQAYRRSCDRRERTLRERVAYLLWVMAHRVKDGKKSEQNGAACV
jgi:hypothetical protein